MFTHIKIRSIVTFILALAASLRALLAKTEIKGSHVKL